jgi:predicted AlkP superfamily pyrophosphatase or phosphodiesterase
MNGHLSWIVLALLFSACQTGASGVPRPSAPAEAPRRVVLLSLDGAGAEELHRLHEEGAFSAAGFARFFREGQVGDRLVPVNPTLTAPNHISLATGYPADRTGIVGNSFHEPGMPFLERASGFEASIETETLWEAARRQGRRVGVVTWPGADDTGERRRADWGMVYVHTPDREAALAILEPGDWEPAGGLDPLWGVESRSPARRARIDVGAEGAGSQSFDLVAVDRTDDGVVNYDGVLVRAREDEAKPSETLAAGAWTDVPCRIAGLVAGPRHTLCPVKLLELDPALAPVRLYFPGVYSLQAYPSDFAAALARRGLRWPGPPDDGRLRDAWSGKPGIDLETWAEQNERFTFFFGQSLLAAIRHPGWHLTMSYMPVIDEAGHQLTLELPSQPGFSPERRDELAAARRRVWQAVDRELARVLAAVDLRTTIVVVVSDHGMAPVHTMLDPNVLLRERGLLAADAEGEILPEATSAYAIGSGGISQIYVAAGSKDKVPVLRRLFADWSINGERPVERVVTRREAAAVGLDHPRSGDLILFLREGYSAHGRLLKEGRASAPTSAFGMHGYLNTHTKVHGIYMALGAGIARGNAGTVRTTEVAGRVAGWLGIEKPEPSAGAGR